MHTSVNRGFELDHPAAGGFASSPWAAAVLGHHHAAAHAAHAAHASMMQAAAAATPDHAAGYATHPSAAHAHAHHAAATTTGAAAAAAAAAMPMDLHMPQGFPYYRYREDALCWTDRKPSVDEVGNPTSVNARILELRKEKSRDAARSRRGKENFEFYELAKMLPLPAAITSQLDKASIIRLTISYLKLRDFSGHGDPPWNRDGPPPNKSVKGVQSRSRTAAGMAMDIFEQHQGTHILQSLDGFALALAADGRFLYISETVSIYLGLSQVEMTGSSIFDYVHHADHAEMAEQLGLGLAQGQGLASPGSAASEEGASATGTNNPDVSTIMSLTGNGPFKGLDRAFCIRMKSTLTKRGCHFKSSGYRVVLMLCRLRPQYTFSHSRKAQPPLLGMVALAIALPPPSVHEIRLESDMFVTRINFDFRIAHCEPKVSDLLDYSAEELTGKNLYTLCHGEDANKLRKCHVDLINKGQVLTHYYRMMNKNGGYTWIQTCATVVCNSKNADEQNIICVNYIISGREYENLIMDCFQLEDNSQNVKREETSGNDPENGSPDADHGEGHNNGGPPNQHQDPHRSPPDIEDGSSEGPSDPHGRGRHMDHITQLQAQNIASIKNTITGDKKDSRKGHKRKSTSTRVDETSGSEEDEVEESVKIRGHNGPSLINARNIVMSPASSSCHSTTHAIPVTDPNSTSPKILANSHEPENDTTTPGTSVKDLEHAMSKHLPATIVNKTSKTSPTVASHQPTDFSTDALLKQQQQRSTIQWIGAHHHFNHLNHHQQLQHAQAAAASGGAPLPASALLRQLYANRESVIRANVHGTRTGGGGTSWSDVNQVGPLPTPPGSEGSSAYGEHQFVHQKSNNGTGSDAFGSLVSSYSTGGTGGYSMDYHSAMTPPSSVSPRDKHQLHSGVSFDSPVYSDVLRHQYLGGSGVGVSDSPAQPLPLKPQVYSAMHPSALDAAAAAYGSLDQSQFYHHGPSAAGFHLYHPANKSTSGTPTVNDGRTSHTPQYRNLSNALATIFRQEGIRGLYKGVMPNVWGSGSAWGFYFLFYNSIKTWIQGGNARKPLGPTLHMIAAAEAGILTLVMTNPIWVVKTRLCLQYNEVPRHSFNDPTRYRGMYDALVKIYKYEGVKGLYKGFVPGMFGVSHGALQFMIYEEMKNCYNQYRLVPIDTKLLTGEYLLFAAVSKLLAAAATYPYQVIRARLQDQHHNYLGTWDCIQKTWKFERTKGFYKGLVPYLIHVTPNICLVMLIYEKFTNNNS